MHLWYRLTTAVIQQPPGSQLLCPHHMHTFRTHRNQWLAKSITSSSSTLHELTNGANGPCIFLSSFLSRVLEMHIWQRCVIQCCTRTRSRISYFCQWRESGQCSLVIKDCELVTQMHFSFSHSCCHLTYTCISSYFPGGCHKTEAQHASFGQQSPLTFVYVQECHMAHHTLCGLNTGHQKLCMHKKAQPSHFTVLMNAFCFLHQLPLASVS